MRTQSLLAFLATTTLALAANIPLHVPRQATAPSPHQPNIIPTCTAYYKVVSGDTCFGIMNSNQNFTLSDFYAWNPDVGNTCSNLLLNYYVCINAPKEVSTTTVTTPPAPTSTCPVVPTPAQPGMIACCKKFYKVVEGDSCVAVENKFTISDANFRKWNTQLDKDCFNLFKNYYVCVGV